jgi:hypothetical protein
MPKKPTLESQYVESLIALGWEEKPKLVGARVFQHPGNPQLYVFVGKAGSIRVGRTRSESRVVTEGFKLRLVQVASLARSGGVV